MKMTVYLPDELHERVKAAEGLNVSATVQRALETELLRRDTLARLTSDMSEISLYVSHGEVDGRRLADREVEFIGRHLVNTMGGRIGDWGFRELDVYLTKQQRFAVAGESSDGTHLYVFDDLDALAEAVDPETVADVAEEIGIKRPVRLDI